jgi:UDP-N-acetylmuramate dehydrogenase
MTIIFNDKKGNDAFFLNHHCEKNIELAPMTWFKVGGSADYLFRPVNEDNLSNFIKNLPSSIPYIVIGAASNLLIRDGGFKGVVIRLGRGFSQMLRLNETDIFIGAAVPDMIAAKFFMNESLDGGAFLRGIPGTIGGALRMNAGAYGSEMKDIFVEAYAITQNGDKITLSYDDMQFSYRNSALSDVIFTGVKLRLTPSDKNIIAEKMDYITNQRQETQPVKSFTGGSTFKNPVGHKAWSLIDKAGCRGLQIGDAQVSQLHCNFIVNHGTATAYDIELLGETVRRKVFDTSGILLEWEIKRMGDFAINQTEIKNISAS